jgi:putative ABC transport system substrate-binding protein
MIRRRDFITLLGGAAAAWPLAARAQQPTVPVIGFLGSGSADGFTGRVAAFHRGLGETGYVEGRNVAIEYRWANNVYDRLPELAADLVRRQVAVIVTTNSTPTARAAKAATTTIPIVFALGADPVEIGLVESMNRPGGNITGITGLGVELGPKRLELLHELLPDARDIATLINPKSPVAEKQARNLDTAARALGLRMHVLHASTEQEFGTAFATLAERRAAGLMINIDPFFTSQTEQLATLTLNHAVPAIFVYREFAAAGGLMSYGGSFTETSRMLGIYSGRILKGEKPANLPVQQVTKVEMFLNLKTAKRLGITVPLPLSGRADEVIE